MNKLIDDIVWTCFLAAVITMVIIFCGVRCARAEDPIIIIEDPMIVQPTRTYISIMHKENTSATLAPVADIVQRSPYVRSQPIQSLVPDRAIGWGAGSIGGALFPTHYPIASSYVPQHQPSYGMQFQPSYPSFMQSFEGMNCGPRG